MKKILSQTRRPDITFYRNGLIRLTTRIVRTLNISPGDSINIICGGGEYLLYAVHHQDPRGQYEACCFPAKKDSNYMCAQSVQLSRGLLDMLSIEDNRAAFAVGEPVDMNDGVRCLPIITLRPILK